MVVGLLVELLIALPLLCRGVLRPPRARPTPAPKALRRWRGVVISLDRRPGRFRRFSTRASRIPWFGSKFCRSRGVDLKGYTWDHMPKSLYEHGHLDNSSVIRTDGVGSFLTPGAVGCYESHMQALKVIAEDESIDFGLIAEDDLGFFSHNFAEQFRKLENTTEAFWRDADKVHLQWCGNQWKRAKNGTTLRRRNDLKTDIINLREGASVKCTGLYAVSRKAAKLLSDERGPMYPIRWQLDAAPTPFISVRMFNPPIAQTLGKGDPGGTTDVQLPRNGPRSAGEQAQGPGRPLQETYHIPDCEPVAGTEWLEPLRRAAG